MAHFGRIKTIFISDSLSKEGGCRKKVNLKQRKPFTCISFGRTDTEFAELHMAKIVIVQPPNMCIGEDS